MTIRETTFATVNAKKLSATQVADSFVEPASFSKIASSDHCFIVGPRGSGKTTLLRMVTGPSLMAWTATNAESVRTSIDYAAIFLPADQLWASQVGKERANAVFAVQMLYALVETMMYRAGQSSADSVHLPVEITAGQESEIVSHCEQLWGVSARVPSFLGLLNALDLKLGQLSDGVDLGAIAGENSLELLTRGIRAFNRIVGEGERRWALLLDEMELAPPRIHNDVHAFVRGGAPELILKISMSPFDLYMDSYGAGRGPVPGHDFQVVYLADHSRKEATRLTEGLWAGLLRERGMPFVSLAKALGSSQIAPDIGAGSLSDGDAELVVQRAYEADRDFAQWLDSRGIALGDLAELSYNARSATVRKVVPLLIFRDSVLGSMGTGLARRRSRKKRFEPFTGAQAVVSILEGNPRWIKIAFTHMLESFDNRTRTVPAPAQFSALQELAMRFEALLRVLPSRSANDPGGMQVTHLVDSVGRYFSSRALGAFVPDPPGTFSVDDGLPKSVMDSLVLGLYAGAFYHVRSHDSPAILSSFYGQRFRLSYLLALRDGSEFPLRKGKVVQLSRILYTVGGSEEFLMEPLDLEGG